MEGVKCQETYHMSRMCHAQDGSLCHSQRRLMTGPCLWVIDLVGGIWKKSCFCSIGQFWWHTAQERITDEESLSSTYLNGALMSVWFITGGKKQLLDSNTALNSTDSKPVTLMETRQIQWAITLNDVYDAPEGNTRLFGSAILVAISLSTTGRS